MKPIYAWLLAALPFAAAAQNLSTEVVVDRSIVPEERPASRPSWVAPEVVLPSVEPVRLAPSLFTEVAAIDRRYGLLNPAPGAFAAVKSPYRGYLSAGYFPTLDFGVSAGYRFVDKRSLSLGARLQFGSQKYSVDNEFGAKPSSQFMLGGTAGIDLAWMPRANASLDASAQYSFLRQKAANWQPCNTNSGAVSIGWRQSLERFGYHASLNGAAEGSSLTFNDVVGGPAGPFNVDQQLLAFEAGAYVTFGQSSAGIDLSADYLHTSAGDASAVHAIGVTPYYAYASKRFSARLGIRLDAADKFGVMPAVKLQWLPADAVGLWADVSGGTRINPFQTLRQTSVYQVFDRAYGTSKLPVAFDAGVNFGPFHGFYVGVTGGYAVADNWLMMAIAGPFRGVDVRGWHAGARVGGEWRFVKAELSADFAPSSFSGAWYAYRDRANTVIKASVALNPIEALTVNAGYEFRGGRKAYLDDYHYSGLGCVSDLSLGAEYRFTPSLTVFARIENLLGRRHYILPSIQSPKLSGLLGLSYKF